jgi:hypothetical protein
VHDLTIEYIKTVAQMAVVAERLSPSLIGKHQRECQSCGSEGNS